MKIENFNSIAKEIHECNKLRGFEVEKENVGQTLMLVVSELAEAMEADRKGRHADLNTMTINGTDKLESNSIFKNVFEQYVKDTFEDEIADTMIRLFDLCGAFNIDIEKHIEYKLRYNSLRGFKHGKRY